MPPAIELDRPAAPRRNRSRRRWLVGLAALAGAVVTTVATGAAYVVSHPGNEPMPSGVHGAGLVTVADLAAGGPVTAAVVR